MAHMETTNTYSILVIKDNPQPFELDEDLRRSGSFDVTYRKQGQDINDCMTTNDPDFVILDLQVAQSEFIKTLKVIRKSTRCPIMAVLPPNGQFDEAVLLENGADTVIARPYDSRLLLAHIGSQMRRLAERMSAPDSKHGSNTELRSSTRPYPNRSLNDRPHLPERQSERRREILDHGRVRCSLVAGQESRTGGVT